VCLPGNSFLDKTRYKYFQIRRTSAFVARSGSERLNTEGLKMKKLVLALFAVAAFTGSALAADLPARTYTKAPAPMPVAPSWTGFYIFGGGGGGIWDANDTAKVTATGLPLSINSRTGGDGWFGTVGLGYDWQFNGPWVFGLLADGQFGSLKGNIQDPTFPLTGSVKMQDAWAVGARVGYLVAPNVLSYVNGGWSGSHWSGTTLLNTFSGLPVGGHTNSFNLNNGFFVGGGFENNLNIFGISAPGWFMKTEYRAAYYGNKNINELVDGNNALVGRDIAFKPFVQTISTSLVYRFNWTGPVVAKY
jgi:outer membrane immunogenic protein